jgi:hypothetical protein
MSSTSTTAQRFTNAATPDDPGRSQLGMTGVAWHPQATRRRKRARSKVREPVKLCLAQYLDGAVAAVDPDPVAAVQEHGGVAASDDGWDAEFAGHDRGVGQWRADVGYDCGGAGEDRRPADVGDRGDEDLAVAGVVIILDITWAG